jgi:hypothetical protein
MLLKIKNQVDNEDFQENVVEGSGNVMRIDGTRAAAAK